MWTRLFRTRWPWIVAAAGLIAAYASTWFEVRGDPRPLGSLEDIERLAERSELKVLFVVIDTLRAHRLGSYGYRRDTSPTLDYLASTGLRLARHQSQSSWTKCSMASLWSARNPMRSGVLRFDDAVPPEATLAAERLQDAGFLTAGIWRNGWVAPLFGFSQGFDLYERPKAGTVPPDVRRRNPHVVLDGTDDDVIESAIEFLRANGSERWFLYVHLMDVHQYTYDDQTALFGTAYPDLYDNSVRREDRVLARLLWHLADEGYLNDTLLIVASDHGEAFRERGLEGHARGVYRETTEVPLIVAFPFRLEPGIVLEAPTRNIDVWPTILDLLGLPELPEADGRSLLPLVLAQGRGEPLPDSHPPGIAHLDRSWGRPGRSPSPTVSVAEPPFRFVYARDAEGRESEELFDASDDARELVDVSSEQVAVTQRMRELAQRYLDTPPDPWGVEMPRIEVDEMDLNHLRALGYDLR